MTSATRHSRAPLRRASTPERILSAGLATATCVGVVGLLGARTIEANATASQDSSTESTEVAAPAVVPTTAVNIEPTTSTGLTEAQLDDYAAQLATEKDRLDAYRAKLVKAAKKLKKAAAAQEARAQAAAGRAPSAQAATSKAWTAPTPQAAPKAKPKPAAKATPQAKPAPKPVAAPAPQPAPKPQSNTKSS